jgi:hypothetical protein
LTEVKGRGITVLPFLLLRGNIFGIGSSNLGLAISSFTGPKTRKRENAFGALEWLEAMCSYVPNKGEQMVRYYGYCSNVCRDQRKKTNEEGLVPCILQTEESFKEYRKN